GRPPRALGAPARLGPPWEPAARRIRARGDPLGRKDLRVTGRDLMEAGIPRGPKLGEVLDRLVERVVEDPSLNTREALLTIAREML
ncbi:MAG TPA: hypothetical protein VNK43_07760, partial [Gemmatimonadales bacterium]|nr:hypothetical protein [Gemmatimonadales bacterium]